MRTVETYIYGKFKARIKGDDKKGTCTSLFTFWRGSTWEPWNQGGWSELDVELVPSSYSGTYSTNIIYSGPTYDGVTLSRSIADP